MSPTVSRHREIANGAGGDVRLAHETIAEIMKYREALFRAAPSHQGGHSDTGAAIAHALDIAFPINMKQLEAAAKDDKMDTHTLWPWLYKPRVAKGR